MEDGQWVIKAVGADNSETLLAFAAGSIAVEQWYQLDLVVELNKVTLYADGQEKVAWPRGSGRLTGGRVGVMVRDGKAEFQELEVWDVTAATKTYALGGQRVALRRDGALSYIHTDHLGSASVLTDASGHEIAGTRLRYYPFGAPRPEGATGTHNAFATGYSDATFTGQRRDVGTGLYFYGARYYDSAIGRFLAPDSIVPQPGDPQALNRYSYVGNRPTVYRDPTGHMQVCADGDEGGGCGVGANYANIYELFRQKDSPLFEYYAAKAQLNAAILAGASESELESIAGFMEGAYTRGNWWVAQADYDPVVLVDPGSTFRVAAGLTNAGARSVARFVGNIYRSATGSKDSLTPRPGIDDVVPKGGLSFFDSVENPAVKPGKYVEIDTAKLRELLAIHDDEPPGHVTVRPPTYQALREWAATRGSEMIHPYTQELLDAMTVKRK